MAVRINCMECTTYPGCASAKDKKETQCQLTNFLFYAVIKSREASLHDEDPIHDVGEDQEL